MNEKKPTILVNRFKGKDECEDCSYRIHENPSRLNGMYSLCCYSGFPCKTKRNYGILKDLDEYVRSLRDYRFHFSGRGFLGKQHVSVRYQGVVVRAMHNSPEIDLKNHK